MRVLVCGSRDRYDWRTLEDELYELNKEEPITHIIHGDAPGMDRLAKQWAVYQGVLHTGFPADWKRHGPSAGPIRNGQMLREGSPEFILAFPSKDSVGTLDMISQAEKAGVPVKVIHVDTLHR
jgi:hypothetical protein